MISLVDGTNLAFRFWHGIPPKTLYRIGKHEVFNNVLQGWFNQIARFLEGEMIDPDLSKFIVVFDGRGNRIRDEVYPEYKANRAEVKPEGFLEQIKLIKRMTSWLGIPVVTSPDEADPALAWLAHQQKGRVQVITSDKDLMQLVNENVTMLRPDPKGGGFTCYDEEKVVQKMGVVPRLIPQLLALQGDASDNVPGVKGVGPKKAAELINSYGSLVEILKSANQLPPSQRANLLEARPMLPTYLRVVKIEPLPVEVPPTVHNPVAFMQACGKLGLLRQLEAFMELGLIV